MQANTVNPLLNPPPQGPIVLKDLRGRLIGEGSLNERRRNKLLKHEQVLNGDIICILQKSSPIPLSSSSVIVI